MKATVRQETEVEIKNGYYKHFAGGYLFVKETEAVRLSDNMISKSDELHAYEVREIQNGELKECTPTEFWAAYQQTMSTFMLEYQEHVTKGKAADFITEQSDRAGEIIEKHVV
jgi:hypothetical protein